MFWRRKGEDKKKDVGKRIEGPLWGYMVKQGVIVDILTNLRYVAAEAEVGGKPCVNIRIFDPAKVNAAGITVDDFTTFDEHPEHILYEGHVDRLPQPTEIDIRKRQ